MQTNLSFSEFTADPRARYWNANTLKRNKMYNLLRFLWRHRRTCSCLSRPKLQNQNEASWDNERWNRIPIDWWRFNIITYQFKSSGSTSGILINDQNSPIASKLWQLLWLDTPDEISVFFLLHPRRKTASPSRRRRRQSRSNKIISHKRSSPEAVSPL